MNAIFHPAERIASIGVSEILKITGLANDLKREDRDIIALGIGEPDFDTPSHIKKAAARAMRAGATKYTALDGTAELKAAIAGKFLRDNNLAYATEIIVTAGAKQVLYNAMMASLDPEDEVIIPTPFWVTYADIILIAGGKPVLVLVRKSTVSGSRLMIWSVRLRPARAGSCLIHRRTRPAQHTAQSITAQFSMFCCGTRMSG